MENIFFYMYFLSKFSTKEFGRSIFEIKNSNKREILKSLSQPQLNLQSKLKFAKANFAAGVLRDFQDGFLVITT